VIRVISAFGAVVLCASLLPSYARAASDTHYQDTLIGERAAGMGGAFTALANEGTGAFYNPAGIVVDASTLIQVSMSAYKFSSKRTTVIDLCGAEVTEDDGGFFGFPAALGFVKLIGARGGVRHAIGLNLAVPTMDKVSQAAALDDVSCGGATFDMGDARLLTDRVFVSGLSYAVRPLSWVRFGVTLGFASRGVSQTDMTTFVLGDATQLNYPSVDLVNVDVTIWSLFLQAGVVVEPWADLRVGLSVTSPYATLDDEGRLDLVSSSTNAADWQSTTRVNLDDATYAWKVPLRLALGLAYAQPRRFTVAADVSLHLPVDAYDVVSHPLLPPGIARLERELVINVNLGAELLLAGKIALRAGFFTKLSSHPALKVGVDDFADKVDYFGGSLGVSYISSDNSSLGLVVQAQYGVGEAKNVRFSEAAGQLSVSEVIDDMSAFSMIIGLGGGFDLR
jgi:long-chain fatty acid transport protein